MAHDRSPAWPPIARVAARAGWLLPALGAAWAASARGADPQLTRVQPLGGRQGAEVVVELVGDRIGKDPQELLRELPGLEVVALDRADDRRCTARLRIAPDAPLGAHPLRVRTATGVTNLLTFHVGCLPEIDEQEPNDRFESPQTIPRDVTVRGVVANEDIDYYAVEATAGERLSVEIEGLRLGRTFFDPALAVLDARRFEVAACDDAPLTRQDACVSLLVPETGSYVIAVREAAFGGNDDCAYRLHVGRFPRPTIVYPPGGPPGATLEVRWLGDPRGPAVRSVTLPAEPAEEHLLFFADEFGTAPSGVPVRVLPLPNVLEAEPNGRPEEAVPAAAPGAFCGIIDEPGDHDLFRFAARKDQTFDVRVHARRLRSPLDAILRVLDAGGQRLAGNDDEQSYPDSYVAFRAPADGDYLIEVEDHRGQGGPEFVYRVEVAEPQPAVDVRLEEQQRYVAQSVEIPQGNRTAVAASVVRRHASGELELAWSDLPPGASVTAPPLAADFGIVPLVFSAAADAPLGGSLARLAARTPGAADGGGFVSRFEQQTWLVRGSNNVPVWSHFSPRAPVAVTAAVPFALRVVPPRSPLVQNGEKLLRAVVERAAGFDRTIGVRLLYNPPGMSSHASLTIPPDASEIDIPLTAAANAAVRDWPLAALGRADVDGRTVVSSELFTLRIAPPYVAASFPSVAVEPGCEAEYPVELAVRTPFAGAAPLELGGLPPGVSAAPQSITAETTRVVFRLQVAADAPTGAFKQLFCKLAIAENGETVDHVLASGELRIDPPPPPPQAPATSPAGGPSS
jgi:hypothetical protein